MTKNAKTVVFASIVAIMLLSFPIANSAYAEGPIQTNISDQIDFLIQKFNSFEVQRQQIKQDIRNSDPNNVSALEKQLQTIETKMDGIEDKAMELALQEEQYAPSRTTRAVTEGGSIYAHGSHTSCSNWGLSSYNTATGVIDTNIDIISWTWAVADEKSVDWFSPFCITVYLEEISMTVRNNSVGQPCTMVTSNVPSGELIQTCDCGLNEGNLLSWAVKTTYEPYTGSDTSGNDDWRGLHRIA